MDFICKKLCVYSYMFKLQSASKFSTFDAMHLWRCFIPAQESFWIHRFWCLLVLLLAFVLPLPHSSTSPLRTFFIQGNKKKGRPRQEQITREGGAWGSCCFGSKTAEHSAQGWAGALLNHPSWNGQTHWKNLQKKFTEAGCSLSQ